MPDLQGDGGTTAPASSDAPVGCNILDPSTYPQCGKMLGDSAGKWLESNACGDLCVNGQVVASRPCPAGKQPTSLGCGSKQLPASPPTNKEKVKSGVSGLLDRYSDAIASGDPLAVVGTVAVLWFAWKKIA